MKLLKTKFLSFIFSVLAFGSVLAPPPKTYAEFVEARDALFDFDAQGSIFFLPKPNTEVEICEFLKIPIITVSALAIEDPFFSDENKKNVNDVLSKLRDLLSKNKRLLKTNTKWSNCTFVTREQANETDNEIKFIVPKKLLESDAFKAYCQAAGYSVNPQNGDISKIDVNYAPLLNLLANNFPGKREWIMNKRLKTLSILSTDASKKTNEGKTKVERESVAQTQESEEQKEKRLEIAERQDPNQACPCPDTVIKTDAPVEQPYPTFQDDDKESVVVSEDEGSDESETPSEQDIKEFEKIEEVSEESKITPVEEDFPNSKSEEANNDKFLTKFAFKRLSIEQVLLPLGAAIFLGLSFADKIKGCFVKKCLNRKLNKKHKRGFNRARTLCLAAGLICLAGSFFVFSKKGFKKTG